MSTGRPSLEGKVALVTGAASGIGRATATLFAKKGAKIVVVDVDPGGGQDTVAQIQKSGGQAIFFKADVSSEEQVRAMIDTAIESYGKLDVLHNNAGIMRIADSLDNVTLAQWSQTLAINATGVFLGCKHGLPAIRKSGGGVIINTITGLQRAAAGWDPAWGASPDYVASKGAVHYLTQHIASLGAPHNIRVNCLSPCGGVDTGMGRDRTPGMSAAVEKWGLLKPEDLAIGALYLATTAQFSGAALAVTPTGKGGRPNYDMSSGYTREALPDFSYEALA